MKTLNIIITVGLLFLSTVLFAHTGIKSTSPKHKAVLEQAPKALDLTFKGAVRLMKVRLLNSNQAPIKLEFKPSAKAAKSFAVPLPELTLGKHQANWMIMAKDGHKIKGKFVFTINSLGADPKAAAKATAPAVAKSSDQDAKSDIK